MFFGAMGIRPLFAPLFYFSSKGVWGAEAEFVGAQKKKDGRGRGEKGGRPNRGRPGTRKPGEVRAPMPELVPSVDLAAKSAADAGCARADILGAISSKPLQSRAGAGPRGGFFFRFKWGALVDPPDQGGGCGGEPPPPRTIYPQPRSVILALARFVGFV